ncbi:hypothetical protein TNCV_3166011 [Trichonephila clavipes]|uniref:Uncharacterized protein n=1 Tax=Trichonephila clavipes TaxID=2585209 RepID=A0A8X6R9T9_TRICX|nr:hypothetical protein TNCV_3166011 [Trichonephila clavipes]
MRGSKLLYLVEVTPPNLYNISIKQNIGNYKTCSGLSYGSSFQGFNKPVPQAMTRAVSLFKRRSWRCAVRPRGWNKSAEIEVKVVTLEKIPEGSELANMFANDTKMAANDAKNDADLTLPPRFRQVLIESPL